MQVNVLRESENFSNSSLHHIFEPENFRTVSFLLSKIAKPRYHAITHNELILTKILGKYGPLEKSWGRGWWDVKRCKNFFVHIRWKSFFFFLLGHNFVLARIRRNIFLINNFLRKFIFCFCPTQPITFAMVHPRS